MSEKSDSSAGCIVAIGVALLFAIAALGIGGAGLVYYKQQKEKAAAKAEQDRLDAIERAKREAELATDAGVAAPLPTFAYDAGLWVPSHASVIAVPIGTSPVLGPSDALVTVVEFSDFQCPFCSRVQPTLTRLKSEYGADLRIVWKNEPLAFHPNAEPAAQMALEVRAELGNGGFWKAHDAIFGDQSHLTTGDLMSKGTLLGASGAKISDAIATHKFKKEIDEDQALAKTVGASGTPTFFVNGRLLSGAQPYASFQKLVDEELLKAKALVASGVPRAKVYESLVTK